MSHSKRGRFQQAQAPHSWRFIPIACTTIIYHNLIWKDFSIFFNFYFNFDILKWHVDQTYPTLIKFYFSLVDYKENKCIPLKARPILPTS
jgi:hypothetical protein